MSRMRWEAISWLMILLSEILVLILVVVTSIQSTSIQPAANGSVIQPGDTADPTEWLEADESLLGIWTPPPAAESPALAAFPTLPGVDAEPRVFTGEQLSMVFGGQGASDDAAFKDMLSAMAKTSPDAVFLLGNIIPGSSNLIAAEEMYAAANQTIGQVFSKSIVFPALGQNEGKLSGTTAVSAFSRAFSWVEPTAFSPDNEIYHLNRDYGHSLYYVDIGYVRVFVLNTRFYNRDRQVSWSVRDWVMKNIDSTKNHHIIAMYDTPYRFLSGDQTQESLDAHEEERMEFIRMMKAIPNAVTVCGFEPLYARYDAETKGAPVDFVHFSTGGTYPTNITDAEIQGLDFQRLYTDQHFIRIELQDNGALKVQGIDLEGDVFDECEIPAAN